MFLTIPYQILEISYVQIANFIIDKYGKSLYKLSYKDNSVECNDISILTPPLKVIDYNPNNNKLRLDLTDQALFYNKLFSLQEYIIATFFIRQQQYLFSSCYSYNDIKCFFNFLLDGLMLNIFIFPNTIVKSKDKINIKMSDIKPGDTIRCVIKLQGIVKCKSLRLRLQHSVPKVWYIT